MSDKIKPLKIENPSTGGTELDMFPTETDPSEDLLAAKGVAFENTETMQIYSDANEIKFKDTVITTAATLEELAEKIQYKDLSLANLNDGWVITWDNSLNTFKMLPTGGGGTGVTPPFTFSRSGNNPSGTYLKTGDTITSNTGQPIRGTNKITEIRVTASATVSSDTVVQIQRRTAISTFSDVTGAAVTITTGNYKATNTGLDISFGPDDEMSVYIKSGDALQNPVVIVFLVPA